jgi:hypothetical protein
VLLHQRVFKPDVIVGNVVALMQAVTIAEMLAVPMVLVSMQMLGERSRCEVPFCFDQKLNRWLPRCLIGLSWDIMFHLMYTFSALPKLCQEWNVKRLGQRAWTHRDFFNVCNSTCHPKRKAALRADVELILARSPLASPPPPDWPEEIKERMMGNFVIKRDAQVKHSIQL